MQTTSIDVNLLAFLEVFFVIVSVTSGADPGILTAVPAANVGAVDPHHHEKMLPMQFDAPDVPGSTL